MSFPYFDEFLERNKKIVASGEFVPRPAFVDAIKSPVQPHTVIVCCSDPRAHPEDYLDIKNGETLIFRTPAGTFPVENFLGLDSLVPIDHVIIIRHKDCGGTHIDAPRHRKLLKERAPESIDQIAKFTFGTFKDPADAVREQVKKIRAEPLLRQATKDGIRGFVMDIFTGTMEEVTV